MKRRYVPWLIMIAALVLVLTSCSALDTTDYISLVQNGHLGNAIKLSAPKEPRYRAGR